MAKKKAGHETIVADDGGGALVLPRNADPKWRKEAEDMFNTVKDGFAHLVALEVGKTRVALYKPKTEDKRGWLFMDQSGHSYHAARADNSKVYVATCSGFPTVKWIARTKKNALAGIRNVVKVAEQAIHNYGHACIAEINRKEIEAAKRKKPGKR
jgi:hypothetical protein